VSEPSPPPAPPSSGLGDAALARLRAVVDAPDVSGTRYELLEPIGRGGMGAVWRAYDRQLERDVALKVLAVHDDDAARTLAGWLEREAKVLARLEHPGIVPVHDTGVLPDGRPYYAMKLVRGPRLDQLVRAGLPEGERFRIFARVCEAVAFAHARGVVHRDLKPGNVMVGEFGEVLVLDWGLARVRGMAGGADRGVRVGTVGWMAPEQEAGAEDVDARADVFSLGRLFDSLGMRGKTPAAIVARATAPAREERYASVLELADEVARFQADEPVRALPERIGVRLARIYRRYRAVVWLIATYLALRTAFELWRVWGRGAGD